MSVNLQKFVEDTARMQLENSRATLRVGRDIERRFILRTLRTRISAIRTQNHFGAEFQIDELERLVKEISAASLEVV